MVSIGTVIDWFAAQGRTCIVGKVDRQQVLTKPWTVEDAAADNLSFIGPKHADKLQKTLSATACKAILLSQQLYEKVDGSLLPAHIAFIISTDPKSDLIAFCALHFPHPDQQRSVSAKASIASGAAIGKNVHIEDFVSIESGAVIGDNCSIAAGAVIRGHVTIGSNVSIGAGTVIGGVGFGYAKSQSSSVYEQFPHYGGVIIGNDISIGGNVCIDRGSLSNTVIHDGVKIDNLVHVAHNVVIGKNSLIIAQSMLGGSAIIGENCWVAPCACIRNGVVIGDDTTVGLASTVTKDVAPNSTVLGSPAVNIEEYLRQRAALKKL